MDGLTSLYNFTYNFLDLMGVLTASVLGGLVARERHFDVVGFVFVCVVSALGGGMLRDILIEEGPRLQAPPVALTNPWYLSLSVLGAVIAYALRLRGKWVNGVMTVLDAFVIGCWSATGAVKCLNAGFDYGWNILPAVFMGLLTAVGGGIMRDILVGRTPVIFGGNTLYATASIFATFPAIALWYAHRPVVAMVTGTVVGGVVVILAHVFEWRLPGNTDYSVVSQLADVSSSFARRLAAGREAHREKKAVKQAAEEATRRRHEASMSLRARSANLRGKAPKSKLTTTATMPAVHPDEKPAVHPEGEQE